VISVHRSVLRVNVIVIVMHGKNMDKYKIINCRKIFNFSFLYNLSSVVFDDSSFILRNVTNI
jgi:hypothetical protein